MVNFYWKSIAVLFSRSQFYSVSEIIWHKKRQYRLDWKMLYSSHLHMYAKWDWNFSTFRLCHSVVICPLYVNRYKIGAMKKRIHFLRFHSKKNSTTKAAKWHEVRKTAFHCLKLIEKYGNWSLEISWIR